MRLSEDRISHISHLIFDGIWDDDLVDFTDDNMALKEIKDVISSFFAVEERAEDAARAKIRSLSRHIPEGSREWEIMYKKYFEEQLAKTKEFA